VQFHPIELYPEELGVTWEEISGAFTKQFVPKLQASLMQDVFTPQQLLWRPDFGLA